MRPHPDRLLGIDASVRALARELYESVAGAPIISPHGHVSPELLATNAPFPDPATLFVTPDHYVTRLLHSSGVPLESLGVGAPDQPPREIWRTLCANWHLFAGTPVRYWFEDSLARVFELELTPSAGTADAVYDQLARRLAEPEFRPRELLTRFGLELLATTDDPADSLEYHDALAAMPHFPVRVIPTFRADAYMTPDRPGWRERLEKLAVVSGVDCGSYRGLLDALRERREYFKRHGATATDAGVADAWATPLSDAEAERIHRLGVDGQASAEQSVAYRRNLLFQSGLMSADDGLVMQLHPGVARNHHGASFARFGPDSGHDIPVAIRFAEPLRELLNAVGTSPEFRIVLFTVDETAFSREIAPLAGFYPSVYIGAPWWFLDAPAAVRRFRGAVTETAGFYKTSGFVDDTRALCSIPTRHDMSRRLDAGYLAELVLDHQLDEDEAHTIARALVGEIPRAAFRL
ncbi:MAG TPA: glucuronate isomerase [Solirubrobacteraceae bacterium]|nr:glucuronate isomerase [Solirubrobacteraceae bacterium]